MIRVERLAGATCITLDNPGQGHRLVVEVWPATCWFHAIPHDGLNFAVEMARVDVRDLVQQLAVALQEGVEP